MLITNDTYEPGNGTRYELLYAEWKNEKNQIMFSISWFYGASGRSFMFRKHDRINAGYLHEKTGWLGSDLAALMGYLKRKGVGIGYTQKEFDDFGRWKGSRVSEHHDNLYLARKAEEFLNEPVSEQKGVRHDR